MAFTVSEFKSNLASGGGGARPSLYEVNINNSHDADLSFGPTSAKGYSGLLVKAAAIPAGNIAPLPVNYAGRAYKWTGFRTFDNWTVTVLNDEDFKIRGQMMEWMRHISGHLDGTRNANYGSPVTTGTTAGYFEGNATVKQLGKDGEVKQVYKFYNLWPTELSEIAVDWSSDMIQEYTIGFAYDYWGHGAPTSEVNVVNAA
jgi:hypothetical protein